MLRQLSIAAIALTMLPAVADAQQRAVDPYGPQTSTAARAMVTGGLPMVAHAPGGPGAATVPSDTGGSMRDEYGNLYNSRGDRIRPTSAKALR